MPAASNGDARLAITLSYTKLYQPCEVAHLERYNLEIRGFIAKYFELLI